MEAHRLAVALEMQTAERRVPLASLRRLACLEEGLTCFIFCAVPRVTVKCRHKPMA